MIASLVTFSGFGTYLLLLACFLLGYAVRSLRDRDDE